LFLERGQEWTFDVQTKDRFLGTLEKAVREKVVLWILSYSKNK